MTTGVNHPLDTIRSRANADSPSVVTLAERGDPDSQAQLGALRHRQTARLHRGGTFAQLWL